MAWWINFVMGVADVTGWRGALSTSTASMARCRCLFVREIRSIVAIERAPLPVEHRLCRNDDEARGLLTHCHPTHRNKRYTMLKNKIAICVCF